MGSGLIARGTISNKRMPRLIKHLEHALRSLPYTWHMFFVFQVVSYLDGIHDCMHA